MKRRISGYYGPLRFGKDYTDEHYRMSGPPHLRPVFLDGEDVFKYNDKAMSDLRLKSIGFVFQSFYLLSRQSALDNVSLPLIYAGVSKKERREKAFRALERVGLADRVDFKPTQLSGGQKQRVAIARAIVNNPKILLADEPTGALDSKSGQQIMDLFQKLNEEGVTVVMITHDAEIAGFAQRKILIRDGQIVPDLNTSALHVHNIPADTSVQEDISVQKEVPDQV